MLDVSASCQEKGKAYANSMDLADQMLGLLFAKLDARTAEHISVLHEKGRGRPF
jgi:hypothetical protein